MNKEISMITIARTAHLLARMKYYININMKTSSGLTNSDLTTCALGAIQLCNQASFSIPS
jgi:hypothetical protein